VGTADGSLYKTKFLTSAAHKILIKLQSLMSEVKNSTKSYDSYYKAKIKGETRGAEDTILDLDLLWSLLEKPIQDQADLCNLAMHKHGADAFNKATVTVREIRMLLASLK
jgi:hypothetical protein